MIIRFIILLPLLITAQNNSFICGVWIEEEKRSHIEIYETNHGLYEGRIVWLAEPYDENGNVKLDTKNPDKELQKRTLHGLTIIKNLSIANDKKWTNGTIYDARTGRTYSLNVTLADIDNLILKGYMGFSFIGKSTKWTRKE
tara:strand:+ start:399 stop:824 length:426 start_codon:yes stop_codon:yes gene_type:complete